jgi:hypothetical protein
LLDPIERCSAVVVKIHVEVADRENVLFRAPAGVWFQGIHAHIDVGTFPIVFEVELFLKGRFRDSHGGGDALHGFSAPAISHQNCKAVGRFESGFEVLPCSELYWRGVIVGHAWASRRK